MKYNGNIYDKEGNLKDGVKFERIVWSNKKFDLVKPGTLLFVGRITQLRRDLQKYKGSDSEADIEAYKQAAKEIEKIGNMEIRPHRLATLNEIKTASYYGADWDNFGWINEDDPQLYNKSSLVNAKNKKVLYLIKMMKM